MFSKRKPIYTTFIILVFCFFIICGLSSFREEQLAVKIAVQQVNNALVKLAPLIETNQLKDLIQTRAEDNSYYGLLSQQLGQSAADYGLAGLYIAARTADSKWYHIADSRPVSDPLHSQLGQEEISAPVTWEKAIRGVRIEPELTRGDRGTVISSYVSLQDEKGQIYAFIAGEYNAAQISDFIYVTLYVQLGIILLSLVMIGWVWRKAMKKE
ncbi:hypothetical protein Sgly_0243 [Syntrophobotulus glycolicus DSM 8271]|uniref:Uncharacterized protein n=1 Tax=Syntrophobotulus glycolicus (strain DSM 8271 / FlGlyR) TaxID=645991 RepID=F0SWS2_SYNGF|nr:hypothetical protein [Syntrophobotulus glycolicus]ADY54612.1 hypothetical protein Sgly_0243 [Syntrophobotulus glycolicus DSM 8271]